MSTPAHEGLAAFVKAVRAAVLLHKLFEFFRDYLVELGATIPEAVGGGGDGGKEDVAEDDPGRNA